MKLILNETVVKQLIDAAETAFNCLSSDPQPITVIDGERRFSVNALVSYEKLRLAIEALPKHFLQKEQSQKHFLQKEQSQT